jgi:protein-arginine kinase activator protein McsA
MTNEEYINLAVKKHGDRYDYSLTIFQNTHKHVTIICKKHGSFSQPARSHIKGAGCKLCKYGSTDEFIFKAKALHGETYRYDNTQYKAWDKNLTIICQIHGQFSQKPAHHLRGSGCPKCGFNKIRKSKIGNLEQWLLRARSTHGEKYDYSKVNYSSALQKVTIICKEHGEFSQRAESHTGGNGCPYCKGVIRTTQRFIEKAAIKQPLGAFTYEHTHYVNSSTPVIITCVDHGPFTTIPSEHLRGVSGCIRCQGSGPEQKWLDSLNIRNRQVKIFLANKKYCIVDGYDSSTNTIYEFYGDFWHGNPIVYNQNDINAVRNCSFGELYNKTLDREKSIVESGYKLITIWEREWKESNPR